MKRATRTGNSTGQGVIEYAAALVMATLLVSMVLAILPGDFMNYFNAIIQAFAGMVTQFLP